MGMVKKYVYTYGKGKEVYSEPKTETEMVRHIHEYVDIHGMRENEYRIFELVPVELVTKTTVTFERTSS